MASPSIDHLRALLDHLTAPDIAASLDDAAHPPILWDGWTVSRISGSQNNRVYRATSSQADLCIKLTLRDQYRRAIREYRALRVLERSGLDAGPRPLLLEQKRYATPIIITTWVAGEPCQTPPTSDEEWERLVELFLAIHTVSPEQYPAGLSEPVLCMKNAADGLECFRVQLRYIPPAEHPPAATALLARLEARPFPSWAPPPIGLCQGDGNFRNLIRRPGTWAAVDWEYSGWGDPAFEFASIIAHAAYLDVPLSRWDRVRELYTSRSPDPTAAERIAVYLPLMYGFWVARFARMLYEVPRGGDRRLTPWPEGWLDGVRQRYQRYLQLADAALSTSA